MLFLLISSFTVCYAILDCLSSTQSLILLIWFCMYSVCSFKYTYSLFSAFLSFWALILIGLHIGMRFSRLHAFLRADVKTANVTQGTLSLAICFVSAFCSRYNVGIDEVLLFVIWSKCFWYFLKCIEILVRVNVYLLLTSLFLSRNEL